MPSKTLPKVAWSVREFATATGVPQSTVYELIKADRIAAVRVGTDPEKRSRYLITTAPESFIDSLALA